MIGVDFVRTSTISGICRTKTFMVDPDKLRSYNRKEIYIQDAFPHLSVDDREFILSGVTVEEWDNVFGKEH